jgi:hypothetical protein
MAEYLAEVRRM